MSDYKNFTLQIFRKVKTTTFIAAVCIAVFELIFSIRVLLFSTPTDSHSRYLICYCVLFFTTVVGLLLLFTRFGQKLSDSVPFVFLHFYYFVISFWSLAISYLDATRGRYPIVFVTVMFALPVFISIRPIYGQLITGIGTGILFWQKNASGGGEVTSGYYLNLIVFVVMAILVNQSIYRYKKINYELEQKLLKASSIDPLTGLYNRRAMDEEFSKLSQSHDFDTMIMADVDNFKGVNDTLGHDIGDVCLETLGKLLAEYFGKTAFRYGGDEFVVISNYSADKISEIFATINDRLSSQFADKYDGFVVHVSVGISEFKADVSVDELMKSADEALYIAKKTAKGSSVVYKK